MQTTFTVTDAAGLAGAERAAGYTGISRSDGTHVTVLGAAGLSASSFP